MFARKLVNVSRNCQKIVNFSESEILWCGIALGYPNEEHAINNYRTPREDLKDFAKFL